MLFSSRGVVPHSGIICLSDIAISRSSRSWFPGKVLPCGTHCSSIKNCKSLCSVETRTLGDISHNQNLVLGVGCLGSTTLITLPSASIRVCFITSTRSLLSGDKM